MQVTELLYTKQTQLERMAAEKAAQQLAHEREIVLAKDDAERVKRQEPVRVLLHDLCVHNSLSSLIMHVLPASLYLM